MTRTHFSYSLRNHRRTTPITGGQVDPIAGDPMLSGDRQLISNMSHVFARTAAPDLVVEAEAVWIGADLLVWIWGGERPHIGAVAAAQPRPSLRDASSISATASVLAFLGHKEDEVAKTASERLAAALNTRVVVAAGMHWDQLSAESIATIRARCAEIVDRLLQELAQSARMQ